MMNMLIYRSFVGAIQEPNTRWVSTIFGYAIEILLEDQSDESNRFADCGCYRMLHLVGL